MKPLNFHLVRKGDNSKIGYDDKERLKMSSKNNNNNNSNDDILVTVWSQRILILTLNNQNVWQMQLKSVTVWDSGVEGNIAGDSLERIFV